MKLDALDHPKTFDFAARLGVELPAALGHLELLWAFTGKQAPQGNIGKWPDGAIARACYWMGRPELFTQALLESGFIDADPEHRLTIHDWHEHAPRWVKSKLKTLGQTFVAASTEDVSPDTGRDTGGDTQGDTKGREGKGREGKGRVTDDALAEALATPSLDAVAFTRWEAYRRDIRKPLKAASLLAAAAELATFGADQAAVVQQSVANGWQGLFELKRGKVNGHGHAAPTPPKRAPPTDAEVTEARRKAAAENAAALHRLGLAGNLKSIPQ